MDRELQELLMKCIGRAAVDDFNNSVPVDEPFEEDEEM